MPTKPNIYIIAVKRKTAKGNRLSLFQRLYYRGEQWQCPLHITIWEQEYDKTNASIVNHKNAARYNRIITESKQTLNDIFLKYELVEHKIPSLNTVVEEYKMVMQNKGLGEYGTEKRSTVPDIIDAFVSEESKNKSWTGSTADKFFALQKHLRDFSVRRNKELRFDNLQEKDLNDFFDYLGDVLKNSNTTLQKKTAFVRWYLRWANRKGYYKGDLHETFRPKFKGGNFEQHKIIYLTQEELKALEEKDFAPNQSHLEHVRDVFLFACYSGLRHSDVSALTPANISNDSIEIVTKKTNDRLIINLNKHTRTILDKYKEWARISGKCLPVISNQKTNDYLKELCKLCGIDTPTTQIHFKRDRRTEVCCPKYELITFHAARRTFITHALRLGIPVPVIMKFSGHHSTNMLKPYMQVVDELKQKEMAKFDEM